jgi:hypothetical protein
VPRRHERDDAIAAEFPRLHRLVANSPFDESESEPRIEDSLDDFLSVADLQIETHLRIADVEGRFAMAFASSSEAFNTKLGA